MARYGYDMMRRDVGRLPRRSPMGMDPNYRDGAYRGQRWYDEEHGAGYGRYRAQHAQDLGWFGGARGRHTGAGLLRDVGPTSPSGPEGAPRSWPEEQHRLNRGRAPEGRPPGAAWGGAAGYAREYESGYAGNPRRSPPRISYDRDMRRQFDAAREFRYDQGMRRYGGRSRGGFSRGYLGSGF